MSEKKSFATSAFGGYDKGEVQDYLLTLKEERQLSQGQVIAQLETLERQLKKETELLSLKEEQLNKANQNIIQLKENIIQEQHRQRINAVSLEALEHKNAQSERLLDSLGGKSESALEKELGQLEAEKKRLEEITAENSKTTAQIGQVLINARMDADEILSSAKNQASSLLQEAEIEAQNLLSEMKSEINEQRRTEAKKLSAKISSMNVDLEQKISFVSRSVDETVDSITSQTANISSYVSQFNELLAQLDVMASNLEEVKVIADESVFTLRKGLGTLSTQGYFHGIIKQLAPESDQPNNTGEAVLEAEAEPPVLSESPSYDFSPLAQEVGYMEDRIMSPTNDFDEEESFPPYPLL